MYEVDGDPAAVKRVIDGWNGEGHVELLKPYPRAVVNRSQRNQRMVAIVLLIALLGTMVAGIVAVTTL